MGNIPDDRDSGNSWKSSRDNDPQGDWRREREEPSKGRRNSFQDHDLIPDATAEIKAMAADGLEHPSTKPVLTGAAIGAVAGLIIPVGPILGGLAGAGVALYKRLRP